jgi:Ni/Fe-hydrogenase subunit HybB-like protein
MPMTWDLGTFLKNAADTLKDWGELLFILLGVVCIIIGIYKIVKGLITHGQNGQPVNWLVAIGLIILGGVLVTVGSFAFVQGIAEDQKKTIEDLGNATTILPILFR